MGRVVIELTNRCNLSCEHCFSGRHGGKDDLPLAILQKILAEAAGLGFDHLTFTGGDPTVHCRFPEVLRLTSEAAYRFSFVTNGWNFATIYPQVLPYRQRLGIITFSMDGASEETHDRLRGRGSFRRVLQAMSVCVAEQIPFSINMVVTSHNRHELELMVERAAGLGSRGLRFGHLMPSPLTTRQNFDLSPWERKRVDAEVGELRRKAPIAVAMAPGHHTTDLFPCAPLQMQEINVDCHGNLGKCCHLSGHGDGAGSDEVVGSLAEMSFADGHRKLVERNEQFRERKLRHLSNGSFQDSDFFPCWYCTLHHKKVEWLRDVPGHPWVDSMW